MMLEVNEVFAGFGARDVLQGSSLHVTPGEIVAVVGPNGSGKSTLLRVIVGLSPKRSGDILIAGKVVQKLSPWRMHRRGVALLLQGGEVFPELTVDESIAVALAAAGAQRLPSYVLPLLELLTPARRRLCGMLSGGERQLLACILVLSQNPRYLLLDEPSANLSTGLARAVAQAVRSALAANDGCALLVEQNVRFALELSDRAYRMAAGQLTEVAIPQSRDADDMWELTFGTTSSL